jgi:hypothetical protein
MLLILIPIAWLAVVTLFVAVCLAAARADAAPPRVDEQDRDAIGDGLVVWDAGAPQPRLKWRSAASVRYRAWAAEARVVRAFHFGSARPEARRPRLLHGLPRRPA